MRALRESTSVIAALWLAAWAPCASGAQPSAAPGPLGLLPDSQAVRGAPGDWVEYMALDKGVPQPAAVTRFLLVETRDASGQPARWLEIWSDKNGESGLRVALDSGGRPRQGAPVLMKEGNAFFELPAAADGDEPQPEPPSASKPRPERVKTPAGTFSCQRRTLASGEDATDVWYSEQVPLLGLVQVRVADGGMVLSALGHRGTSIFPERVRAVRFPAEQIESVLKALVPPAEPVGDPQPQPAACDPAIASCLPQPQREEP